MYNPDYPTTNTLGFQQHTFHPQENVDMTFYGGGTVNPFGGVTDSRRFQQGMPYGYGQQFPTQTMMPGQMPVQEQQVMPFSSYPPATPQNPQYGFNSMAETRRTNFAPVASPWAQPQTPQFPTQTMMPGQMSTMPYPQMQQQSMGFYPPSMNSAALYGYTGSCSSFDRKGNCWDNMYTGNQVQSIPAVNWQQGNMNMNPVAPTYTYPTLQYPKMAESWNDIAKQNWGNL